ncbi:MAG: hypothetical protein AAFY15_14790 [Cyanobacteria bacterium J06648_11]
MTVRRLSLAIALSIIAGSIAIAPALAQSRRESVNDVTAAPGERPLDIFDSNSGLNMNQLIRAARDWDNPNAGEGLEDESIDAEVERFRQTRTTRFGPEIFRDSEDEGGNSAIEPVAQ